MKNATMVYKCPGPHEIHGDHFDYKIVDADEEGAIDQAIEDGWHLTTDEAKGKVIDPATERAFPDSDTDFRTIAEVDADIKLENKVLGHNENDAPPTREELEIKAKELGITVHSNMKDATIAKKIEETLAAKGA